MPSIPHHNVAVLGAGLSGLAVAALLKPQGHDVTIFERSPTPKPSGSGLVLHQSGLAALAHLGLEADAIAIGSTLTRFEGRTVDGKAVFELSHDAGRFSVGIHRHSIFSLLYERVLSLSIPVVARCAVDRLQEKRGEATVFSIDGERCGSFDLVIDASGAGSSIRDTYATVASRRPFPYGALWGVVEARGPQPNNVLRQRFDGASTGIGLIPIGRKPGRGDKPHIGFHWSVRNSDYAKWRATPIEQWKKDVVRLWGDTRFLVDQIEQHDDLTWTAYADVTLKRLYSGRIAFVGDAAHSISPRLGQGANLGLVDALVLSKMLAMHPDVEDALRAYDANRRNQVRFYHSASRWLSVLFQSDSAVAPILRDFGFARMCKIPYLRAQMLDSLAGVKTGLFAKLDVNDLRSSA